MKKTLLIIVGLVLLSTMAHAQEKCAGGNGMVVIGKNGDRYCQSDFPMSWWNAYSWCEGIGMKLITLDECKIDNPHFDGFSCPQFQGKLLSKRDHWTQNARNKTNAYYIWGGDSGIYNMSRSSSSNHYALCK